MARRLEDSETAYRLYMTNSDIYQRGLIAMISEVISFALLIYLISHYSMLVAVALALCLAAYVEWKNKMQVNKMLKIGRALEEDDSFYS